LELIKPQMNDLPYSGFSIRKSEVHNSIHPGELDVVRRVPISHDATTTTIDFARGDFYGRSVSLQKRKMNARVSARDLHFFLDQSLCAAV